jgi:hypothetical protein
VFVKRPKSPAGVNSSKLQLTYSTSCFAVDEVGIASVLKDMITSLPMWVYRSLLL